MLGTPYASAWDDIMLYAGELEKECACLLVQLPSHYLAIVKLAKVGLNHFA